MVLVLYLRGWDWELEDYYYNTDILDVIINARVNTLMDIECCIKSALLVYTWLPSIYTPIPLLEPSRPKRLYAMPYTKVIYIYLAPIPELDPYTYNPFPLPTLKEPSSRQPFATHYVLYCRAPQYADAPCCALSKHSAIKLHPQFSFSVQE